MTNRTIVFWVVLCLIFTANLCFYCSQLHAEDSPNKNLSKRAKVYLDLAMKLQKQRKLTEADDVFSQGIRKHPNSIPLYYFRAKHRHHYMTRYSEALLDYTKVIKMNPRYNPKAFWRRGQCFYFLKQYHLALKDYNMCHSLMPGYDRVYMLRAMVYVKLNMFLHAKKDIAYLIKKNSVYSGKAKLLYKDMFYPK